MSASISSFVSTINKRGIARSNRFVVLIPPIRGIKMFTNPLMNAVFTQIGGKMRGNSALGIGLLCSSADLPAQSFMSSDKMEYPKTREMVPYALTPRTTSMRFLCGRDMFEYYFFQNWQNDIVNRETHLTNYYDEYTTSVIVSQLDEADNVIAAVEYESCYPISVSPINMDWSNKDYVSLNVELNYKRYRPILTPYSLSETVLSVLNKSTGGLNLDIKNFNPLTKISGVF